MSWVTDILLLIDTLDDRNAETLAFWLGSQHAVDESLTKVIRDVASSTAAEGQVEVTTPLNRAGNLMPLTGAVGEELWGGFKALRFSAWGGVAANMHWERFLEQVKSIPWQVPDRFQLLVRDDEDTYFRLYMFRDGELRNFAPPPEDEDSHFPPW